MDDLVANWFSRMATSPSTDDRYMVSTVAVIMLALIHVENVEDISHHDLSS